MKRDIPLPCTLSGGKMYSASYDVLLLILKKRNQQACEECDFEINAGNFKKGIVVHVALFILLNKF